MEKTPDNVVSMQRHRYKKMDRETAAIIRFCEIVGMCMGKPFPIDPLTGMSIIPDKVINKLRKDVHSKTQIGCWINDLL